METTVNNSSNMDMLLFFVPQLQHDAESDHQQLIFQQDCIHLHYHLRCKNYEMTLFTSGSSRVTKGNNWPSHHTPWFIFMGLSRT